MSCNVSLDIFQREDADLDVSTKYKLLMQDSLSPESIYIRAKDTMKVVFDDLQVNETEKASMVIGHIEQLTASISATAMQAAISWAKEERDGAYILAKEKASVELLIAQTAKAKEEVCKTELEAEKVCAEITAIVSSTLRENGTPIGYEEGGCKPTGLDNTGLKYHQTKQVEAATYQAFADAYRKSGIVQVGVDAQDGVTKGLSAPVDEVTSGYTNQQTLNAERQRIAYEDSKRNHGANSSASMIGQMLSAEIAPATEDVKRWRDSVDWLNTSHSSTDEV